MAKYLQVKYDIIDNLQSKRAQLTFFNSGAHTVPGQGWSLYFCSLRRPGLLQDQGMRITRIQPVAVLVFLQSCFHRLAPEVNFKDIASGESRSLQFVNGAFSVARTDSFPNWYLAADGLEPRVLVSTAGEELSFVGPFDTPNKWKRYDRQTEDRDYRDRYNSLTPEERFDRSNAMEDLGEAGKRVLPTPVSIHINEEQYVHLNTKDWVVVSPAKFSPQAAFLGDRLSVSVTHVKPHSRFIVFTDAAVTASVRGRELSGSEAYALNVDPEEEVVEIKASSPAGAFYGAVTLLSIKNENDTVPKVSVVDCPRYAYRGLMLDVARNFFSVRDVMALLEVMSLYKLNTLHLHLSDDEGWRLQIPEIMELTEVGGRRCHDLQENQCILPFLGSGPTPAPRGSGFYTVEDYRNMLRYAADRHIRVIPEFDMPGHGHAAIRAMEARRNLQAANLSSDTSSRYSLVDHTDPSWDKLDESNMYTDNAVNPCIPSTYNFVSTVVQALVDMHRDVMPLTAYHFGGDEVPAGAWRNSTACAALLPGLDLSSNADLKKYFAKQVSNITAHFGLDLAVWEDGLMEGNLVFERSLLPNGQVYAYAWDNIWEWGRAGRAYQLANAGYKVVMAQATHLYFDQPYEPDPEERGIYWASRVTSTKKTFSFMPSDLYANADFAVTGAPLKPQDLCGLDGSQCVVLKRPENIIGMQGELWSEAVRTRQQADFMLFPRVLALAERAWHEAEWEGTRDVDNNNTRAVEEELQQDWVQFANTLGYRELDRLDRLGIEYRVPPPGVKISNGRLLTNVEFPGLQVQYSPDNGATWCDASNVTKPSSPKMIFRTRSASGSRYSRHIILLVQEDVTSGCVIIGGQLATMLLVLAGVMIGSAGVGGHLHLL
ncbi:hypothetical protein C0Q70_14684 [Pomacea canaliculata]|uniref:beta-N-acetylhexosaminidase n=1 Tax=Pomacea canaliculata TaxID=400727 RepID=A0A2T7NSS2_POMCA|nr:hypothetical protein C0Q70_14684 [Pomacea canaliculata]